MRKIGGFLFVLVGLLLLVWVGYNLFVKTLPQAQGRNPLPAILVSVGFIFVGIKWMRRKP